jgi:hypothetical protein
MCSMPRRERATELGGAGEIHLAAGAGGVEGPPSAVGVEGDGQAVRLKDRPQRAHHRRSGLARPELGIEQPLGRVIEDGDEGLALRRAEREPGMAAAIEVQEFAETRARLAAPPMTAPGAPLADEAGFLERELDEGVGQGHAVIAPGEVVEVPHVEAGVPVARPVALAIQAQDALDLRDGRFAARGLPAAPIIEAQDAVTLIPGAPAAQAARMDAENVGTL